MKSHLKIITLMGAIFLLLPSFTTAQELIWHYGALAIAAPELLPRTNSINYDTNGVRMATPDTGTVSFQSPVELPQYSYITRMTLEAFDRSGGEFGGYVKSQLREYRYNTFLSIATVTTGSPEAPGDIRIPVATGHLVNNTEYSYGLEVVINNGAGGAWSEMFYKVIIEYMYPEL